MWVALGLSVICGLLVMPGVRVGRGRARPLLKGTGEQWRRNYGRRSLLRLLGAVAAAGALAYSGLDRLVDERVGGGTRSSGGDNVSAVIRFSGERFWFLNWLLVACIDAWWRSGGFSRWGRRNFEAMVVGLPTLWAVQRGLGADRPSAAAADPRWHPLSAAHSASGHTFMAAIPWLNLARTWRLPLGRRFAYVGSALTGWSRMNDRKHYLSQVILGWTIAWNAVDAVQDHGGNEATNIQRIPDETPAS